MNETQTALSEPIGLSPADAERCCILVLGMHRSGTSVATRIISLLGADLPQGLVPPADNNPTGYWESRDLLTLNDRLLASGGSRWDDWGPSPRAYQVIDQKDVIQTQFLDVLQREFAASKWFVVKDPRICRLVPFWLEVLRRFHTRAVAVLPFRHPFEVAHSLHERNSIPFTEGCLLWLRHVLEAERTTRHIPRAFLNYECLLADWTQEVDVLTTALGMLCLRPPEVAAAAAITEFLKARLRHHEFTLHDLDTRSDVVDWVRHAYHALRSLRAEGEHERVHRELDQIRREFDKSCLAFGGLLREERRKVSRQSQEPIVEHSEPRPAPQSGLLSLLSVPVRTMSAILSLGRRIEAGVRRWRRGGSSRDVH